MPQIRNASVAAVSLCAVSAALAQPCTPTIDRRIHAGWAGPGIFAIGSYNGNVAFGGAFDESDTAGQAYIAIYDPRTSRYLPQTVQSLTPLTGSRRISRLKEFDIGRGPELLAGGRFGSIDSVPGTTSLAAWNGTSWRSIDAPFDPAVYTSVRDFEQWNGKLYVGGYITALASGPAEGVVEYDGTTWRTLAPTSPSPGTVYNLHVHDDGSGEKLYASGSFTSLGGVGPNIARWDGETWEPVGAGLTGAVLAMETFDDGTGERLFVAGLDIILNGQYVLAAAWDGTAWTGVGSVPAFGSLVYDLTCFDDGLHGPALYAHGLLPGFNGSARWSRLGWTRGYGVTDRIASTEPEAYILSGTVIDGEMWCAGNFWQPSACVFGVIPCTQPECPADWDQSGGVDGDDIGAFFTDWAAGNADIDQSGGTDGDDIAFFFQRWTAGC